MTMQPESAVTQAAEADRALADNARYAAQFDLAELPLLPGRGLAVLACMDARLTVEDVLGLRTGDANIIRNAGGLATDDAIRSLVISQHLLGTREIIVIEHTGCGMLTFEDDVVRDFDRRGDRSTDRPPAPSVPGPRGEPEGASRADPLPPVAQYGPGDRPRLRDRDGPPAPPRRLTQGEAPVDDRGFEVSEL